MITAAVIALFKLPGKLWNALLSLLSALKSALISTYEMLASFISFVIKIPGKIFNFIKSLYLSIKNGFELLFIPEDKRKKKSNKRK